MEKNNYKFKNGMLIWPIVKYSVCNNINSQNMPHVTSNINSRPSKIKMVKDLLKGLRHISFKKSKIIFITSTLFNTINKDKQFFNILDDYYANVFKNDSFVFEQSDKYNNWRFPRTNKRVSTITSYLIILSGIISKFMIFSKPSQGVKDFCAEFKNNISIERLAFTEKHIGIYKKLIKLFFLLVKPKLLVINCGCYGGFNAVTIKVAKELNIKVAEIQHGIPNEIAYNENYFANALFYKDYLPDWLFIFGDYWRKYVTLPIKLITIGHPYLNYYKNLPKMISKKQKTILFVSQPTFQEELLKISVDFNTIVNNQYKIIFRLHPAEDETDTLLATLNANKIELSSMKYHDMYDDFLRSDYVCGAYSFALYEAIVFGVKLFLLNNNFLDKFFPQNFGIRIDRAKDIVDSINLQSQFNFDVNYIWNCNFEKNYSDFINKNNILK